MKRVLPWAEIICFGVLYNAFYGSKKPVLEAETGFIMRLISGILDAVWYKQLAISALAVW